MEAGVDVGHLGLWGMGWGKGNVLSVQTLHIIQFLTLKNNNAVNTFGQFFLHILNIQRRWGTQGL